MPEQMPWGDLVLAAWPLWLAIAALVVLGLIDWHAGKVARRG